MRKARERKAAMVAAAEEVARQAFVAWAEKEEAFRRGEVKAAVEQRAWKKYQAAQVAVFDARYA